MPLTNTQRGLISVFGGFTLHLVMGSIFMWGTLNVYVTSYFRQLNDEGLSLSLGGAIFPVMMACVATGMPIGLKAFKYFGSARYYCMGASIVCAALVFASSYAQKFWQYVLIYGIGYGLVSGTNYFVPIYLGYLYFPKKKGFVSGTVLGGYGLCSLVFGLTFAAFVNPDKLHQQKNSDGYSYYEGESVSVAEQVPYVLRKMSYIYVAVSVFGCCFLMNHPDQISEEERKKNVQKQKQNEHSTDKITYELNCIHDDKQAIKQQNEDQTSKCKSDKLKDYDLAEDKDIDAVVQNSDNLLSIKKISPMEQTQNSYNHHKNNNNNEDEEKGENNENKVESEKNHGSDHFLQTPSSPNKKKHENKLVKQDKMLLESQNEVNNNKDHNKQHIETQDKLQADAARIDQLDTLGAPTLKLALSQQQLYMSFILSYLAIGFGIIINGNYKSIAKDYGFNNEDYLNLVGALVSTANGLSRIFWACLLDRFTFKQILTAILLVQIIFSLTIRLSSAHEVFYAIWAFVINATFGGVLGIWPAFSASLNGIKIGSQIYGLYWYSFSLANFTQFLFVNYLKKSMGFNNIFYIYTGMAATALIFLWSYQFRIKWSKYYLKEEQRIETEQIILKGKPQPERQP